ncbi:hypothetical protein GIB67_030172 [Kingdonia uniflora]|uniref:Replication factor C subunit 3 n=1 Tax=Kingdonia uniflora TaxID=39325 RepID=A0A7J7LE60_9MAGN|nr:hypothetical protein GIB67_030172 [Kingdonia uniflora]
MSTRNPAADPSSLPNRITRSSSEPNIYKTTRPSNLSSNRSTCSTNTTTTTSTTTSRTKPKKAKTKKKIRKNLNYDSSELTEESLKEFNRMNALAFTDKKNSSPYYKGLTDSSLAINQQRPPSPDRDTIRTSGTSTSSISTVFNKFQEWSMSCFKSKGDAKVGITSVSSSKMGSTTSFSSSRSVIKDVKVLKIVPSLQEYKPLRERVDEAKAVAKPMPCHEQQLQQQQRKRTSPKQRKRETAVEKSNAMDYKEKEFVWAKKYRPKALKDFICNRDKAEHLNSLVRKGQCSHYIFEGPAGVGKRTMVWALLREAFGPEKLMTRKEIKTFDLKGEAVPNIKVNVIVSSVHVEINLSELCGYEKHVIVELIKETHNMALDQTMECDHSNCHGNFQVPYRSVYFAIVLYEADKLSTDAQLYLRWLLERSKSCNKIFFCCSDISKLHPIKSLCTVIQLLPPSNKEIIEVLEFIAEKEGISLPHQLAQRFAVNSKQNLRQAIRSFEASWQLNSPLEEDQVILTGWEENIGNIAKNIIEEQSPRQLYNIRGKLQNLIEHNVSAQFIFDSLVGELKKNVSEEVKPKIDSLYLEYNRDTGEIDGEKSLCTGNDAAGGKRSTASRKNVQDFMRIEEFTAKFMSFYKCYVTKNVEGLNGDAAS